MDQFLLEKRPQPSIKLKNYQQCISNFLKNPQVKKIQKFILFFQSSYAAYAFNMTSVIFTVVSVVQFCLATMPDLQTDDIRKVGVASQTYFYHLIFQYDFYVEILVNSFFILEITLRFAMSQTFASFFKESFFFSALSLRTTERFRISKQL